MPYLISYDLGTGGLKAGLFDSTGRSLAFEFHPYPTHYPHPDWHEQHPADWWQAVCSATRALLTRTSIAPSEIAAVSSSGHSLVAAPIAADGSLLLDSVPIWSDRRSSEQVKTFFSQVDYRRWYMTTGNGDPPEIYSVFKLMWMRDHQPDIFNAARAVLGSKDYIHYRLTGQIATDYSYASGSGVFDLLHWRYSEEFIAASGLPRPLFLEPLDSHSRIGTITPHAADACGLAPGTPVICGGVDNACMALGTTGLGRGRVYTSLGSSAWIAVTAEQPILDPLRLPFIFAHIEKGYYTSGVSIFAAGDCYRWARDTFCPDFGVDAFDRMNDLAAASPVGANGLMFNPALSGGSSQEPGLDLLGGFFGLKLSTSRADLLRAVLEGVALSLGCYCLPILAPLIEADQPMIICGGGAKSDLWMQIFADVYGCLVVRINVDQEAASLGAAAIAARGVGLWPDYSPLDRLFSVQKRFTPQPGSRSLYQTLAHQFTRWVDALASVHAGLSAEQDKS